MHAVEKFAMPDNSFTPGQSNAVLTPEAVFIGLYVDALRSLQRTWLDTEKMNPDSFTIQIVFLTRMIPDKSIRDTILEEMDAVRQKYQGTSQEHYAEYHAGLTVVSHMIEFLCNSFDLVHTDISGPATSKQYRDAVLEIPDFVPPAKEQPVLIEELHPPREPTTTTQEPAPIESMPVVVN